MKTRLKYYQKYHLLHKEHANERARKFYYEHKDYYRNRVLRQKEKIYVHYGNVCTCCGEKDKRFLTIDHINGGGNKHRKTLHIPIYDWLINNNYPKGFQILCYNCNFGKRTNKICPHQEKPI